MDNFGAIILEDIFRITINQLRYKTFDLSQDVLLHKDNICSLYLAFSV